MRALEVRHSAQPCPLAIADSAVLLQHGEVVYDGPADMLGDITDRMLSTDRP